jgi:PAS domain S-box-containing protein
MRQIGNEQGGFKRALIRTFVLPPLLMSALAGVLLWQINRLLTVEQRIRHTNQVIAQAHQVEKLLVDMETGVRGYLIAGNASFLEPYNNGLISIDYTFNELGRVVADNPAQFNRLQELRNRYTGWKDYARYAITLRESGGDYQGYVRQGLGKGIMDDMRSRVAAFVKVEEDLRDQQMRDAERSARLAIWIGISLTVLLGALLAFLARRQLINVSDSYSGALRSAQRQTEVVRASEERYRLLFESNPHPMWVFDVETLSFLAVNEAAVRHYGYSLNEFLSMTIKDIRPSEDVPALLEFLTPGFSGLDEAGVWRHKKKDGNIIEVEITSHTADWAGRPAEIVLANDITDRRSAERELVAQRLFLRQIIDLNPSFIFAKDREQRFTLVNRSLADAYGTTVDDILGKTDADFNNNPEEVAHFRRDDLEVINTQQEKFIPKEMVTDAAGHVRWLQTVKRPIISPDGKVNQFLGVATDITDRLSAEEELRKLNGELEQRVKERTSLLEAANKDLEAFSYSVSHDLRAPLRAMNGFSRILIEDYAAELSEEAKRYLNIVLDNARQMGQLVDDLLAFSRLGRQSLQKQLVAPADLVVQVLDVLKSEQDRRRVNISINDLPAANADPSLLKQVYVNLLSNALKYTRRCDEALIEIGSARGNGTGEVVYHVRDNGAGFDMKYAGKLFGVFQRLHRAEEFEGTGVGLAIAQRIIHRHGGRIWAEAEENKGATFYFTLEGGSPNDR